MVNGEQIKALVQWAEETQIPLRFVIENPQRDRMAMGVVGVPKYEGFNIDIGEMFSVRGADESRRHELAIHDVERVEAVNSDYWRRASSRRDRGLEAEAEARANG